MKRMRSRRTETYEVEEGENDEVEEGKTDELNGVDPYININYHEAEEGKTDEVERVYEQSELREAVMKRAKIIIWQWCESMKENTNISKNFKCNLFSNDMQDTLISSVKESFPDLVFEKSKIDDHACIIIKKVVCDKITYIWKLIQQHSKSIDYKYGYNYLRNTDVPYLDYNELKELKGRFPDMYFVSEFGTIYYGFK